MYILTKESKIEGTRTRTSRKRIGVFYTKKGAQKVADQHKRCEQLKTNPAHYIIEREHYYTTRVVVQALYEAWQDARERKYNKLVAKRNKLDRQIRNLQKGE